MVTMGLASQSVRGHIIELKRSRQRFSPVVLTIGEYYAILLLSCSGRYLFMSDLASLNVKIDRSVKKEADSIANAMGMTLSTAINIFVRQMVSERAIPFKIYIAENETAQYHQLLDSIRSENEARGFMTDDEINAEIKAYRGEKQGAGV
jgi:DNA-damage-inducible protein J